MDSEKAFLGVGWGFPPEFNKKYAGSLGVKTVEEEDDIHESLMILLSTRPGERVMHPDYGCRLNDIVFEIMNESTITELKDVIERAVLFFESRITLESIDVNTDKIYDGKLQIQLNYIIRRTNTRSNMVYPFYYIEGSQVKL